MAVQPNQTLNKVFAVGIAGGLALIAVLYYPLFVALPGNYINGWQNSSALLGLVFQVLAFALAIGTGYAAARFGRADSRSSSVLFGAIAGTVAGLVVFSGLIGSAAALLSNTPLLAHGLAPAETDAEAKFVLVVSIVRTIWGTSAGLLLSLVAGLGLGALGGLIYTPPDAAAPLDWKTLRASLRMPLLGATFIGGLAVMIIVYVYAVLEPAVWRIQADYHFDIPVFAIPGITLLPMTIAALSYLLPFAGIYFIVRHERKVDPLHSTWLVNPLRTAILYALMAVAVPIIAAMSRTEVAGAIVVLVILAMCSITLAALIFRLCLQVRGEQEPAGIVPPLTVQRAMTALSKVGIFLLAVVLFIIVWRFNGNGPLVSLVILTLIVVQIAWNGMRSSGEPRLAANRQSDLLQAHFNAIVATWVTLIAAYLINFAIAINLALIPVAIVTPLYSNLAGSTPPPAEATSTSSLVSNLYLVNTNVLIWTAVGSAVLIGIVSLFLWVGVRLNIRRSNARMQQNATA